jgi:hypothetical protein
MTIVMNNLPIGNLIIICCLGIDMLKSIIRTFVPNSSKSSVEDQPEDSSQYLTKHPRLAVSAA